VGALGEQITRAYPDGDLILLAPQKGSFMFVADLVRSVRRPVQLDFLITSPNGYGGSVFGIEMLYDPELTLRGKHVLVIEDVVDTGMNVSRVMEAIGVRAPRSLEVCALLHKRVATGMKWPVRFVGFDAPREFLMGYGLDHAEHFRHLPYIVSLE
jgi:hypoxanthine phosphoribosyltransferase